MDEKIKNRSCETCAYAEDYSPYHEHYCKADGKYVRAEMFNCENWKHINNEPVETQKENNIMFYNPSKIHLSGRDYEVLETYPNGNKKIKFPTFCGEELIATPQDLDGTYKERCEKIIQAEKDRIARDHGWI